MSGRLPANRTNRTMKKAECQAELAEIAENSPRVDRRSSAIF